jgi:hypothetical protein
MPDAETSRHANEQADAQLGHDRTVFQILEALYHKIVIVLPARYFFRIIVAMFPVRRVRGMETGDERRRLEKQGTMGVYIFRMNFIQRGRESRK